MEIWEIGPLATANLAGSSVQRLSGDLSGTPTAPDPSAAVRVVELAARLAHDVPVLHDISDGGAAVALAEICIASGVGASVEVNNPFSEDPHRFLAAAAPNAFEPDPDIARRIGEFGGDEIRINGSTLALDDASETWHNALARALDTHTPD
jgi:phosphoribosylformylglycinamidine synthase